jgi:hypothetical protein
VSDDDNGEVPNPLGTILKIHKSVNKEANILANPKSKHVLLLYENHDELDSSLLTYINNGLKRVELCVYASVNLMNYNHIHNFTLQINDYQKNRKEGNLLMLNLEPYYNKAVFGDMQSFEQFATYISDKNYDKLLNKLVCKSIDCGSLLLKNGYFEQGIVLENWLHSKPIDGPCVCPYPKSLFDKFPNDIYYSGLFHSHDVVIDTKGREYFEDLTLKK